MSKKFMRPSRVSFIAAVICHCASDVLVSAEISLEPFGIAPSAENKDSFSQFFRNDICHGFEPIVPAIEIYQEDHEPFGVSAHLSYMF